MELKGWRHGEGRVNNMGNIRGALVPYVSLRDWFGMEGKAPLVEQAVMVQRETGLVGLVVDYVVGEKQTFVKTLGRVYRGIEGFSGATIMGDGTVCLMLDVSEVIKMVNERSSGARPSFET